MKTVVLTLTTMMVSAQSFASAGVVPASVKSTITHGMKSQYTQEEDRKMSDLCKLLQPGNPIVDWGTHEAKVTCTPTGQGLIEITAKNEFGQVSIFANAEDTALVGIIDGDYTFEYINNLQQRLSFQLGYKKYDASTRPPGSKLPGYYVANLYLNDKGTKIHLGYSFRDFQP